MSLLERIKNLRNRGRTPKDEEEEEDDRPDPGFQDAYTRRAIVASLWIGIALTLPLWWKTTTITRLPLPEAEVTRWAERGACPVRIPTQLRLHLPRDALPPSYPHYDERSTPATLYHSQADYFDTLRQHVVRDLDEASGRHSAQGEDDSCLDWTITFNTPGQEKQDRLEGYGYDVTFTDDPHSPSLSSLALALPPTELSTSPPALAAHLASQLRTHFHLPLHTLPLTDTRAIQYTRPLRLVFSLLNEDAARGGAVSGWDLAGALRGSELGRLVDALKGVHEVVVESQVLWFAPLAFRPTKVDEPRAGCASPSPSLEDDAEVKMVGACAANETSFLVEWEDLKVFVNAAAWSLTSAVSSLRPTLTSGPLQTSNASTIPTLVEEEEKTLHLLLYLPAADQRPLRVRDPETGRASAAHAWMVPQWGGVVLLNLPEDEEAKPGEVGPPLLAEDLEEPIRLWTSQLRTLVGLGPASDSSTGARVESDMLAIRRIVESARDAVATLQSTIRLVQKISNLGVGTEVKGDVLAALELLAQLETTLALSPSSDPLSPNPYPTSPHSSTSAHPQLQQALSLASLASTLASRAFFHPSMLGLLYFPEEHKYAVYTPLFGPVAVPLLIALLREVKGWRKGRRRKAAAKGKKLQ
ncbi:hypothetical protein V8E36_002985 [Tilletia maclaganii]